MYGIVSRTPSYTMSRVWGQGRRRREWEGLPAWQWWLPQISRATNHDDDLKTRGPTARSTGYQLVPRGSEMGPHLDQESMSWLCT